MGWTHVQSRFLGYCWYVLHINVHFIPFYTATIAVEYAKELDPNTDDILPTIPYYFGQDFNEASETTKAKTFPSANSGWTDTKQWFNNNLGFTMEETIAIMGAHTLGESHLKYSGYSDLPWVYIENINKIHDKIRTLNNKYYKNLININLNWNQWQSDKGLWEYKNKNNKCVGGFVGHYQCITCVSTPNDYGSSNYVLSNSKDQSMKLWDLRAMNTLTELTSTRAQSQPQTGSFDYLIKYIHK